MQPELLIGVVAAALVVGFLCGYLARAMVSWRRHRRSQRRYEHGANTDAGFRLKRLAGRDVADPSALSAAADAPPLAEPEEVSIRENAHSNPLGQTARRKANGTVRRH